MYIKEFEIRWSDLDPNWHVANASYINFMSHTRMAFMMESGFTPQELIQHNLGPVVFYEHIYYFKELFMGKPIKVSLQLKGLSADGMFFEFVHNIYDAKGRNCARCEMLGSWINTKTRQLTTLPAELRERLDGLEHTEDFRNLTKEDTRAHGVVPKDLVSLVTES